MIDENLQIRKAEISDFQHIWKIILYAKETRKAEGSLQWQDGYPNEQSITNDIENKHGYIIENQGTILAYFALIFDIEPAYEAIEGKWLSEGKYAVLHRIAVSKTAKGSGLGKKILQKAEEITLNNNIFSLRIDTNFDNMPMLAIIHKMGYTYCGEVYFRGSARKAFEKILHL